MSIQSIQEVQRLSWMISLILLRQSCFVSTKSKKLSMKAIAFIHSVLIIHFMNVYIITYDWDLRRLTSQCPGYWELHSSQRTFMDDFAKHFHIASIDDWLKVTITMIKDYGGTSLLAHYSGSLSKVLTILVPGYQQACREALLRMVQRLHLEKVEDLVNVSKEYTCNS